MKNNIQTARPMTQPEIIQHYEEDSPAQAALRVSLLKSMGKGAAAGGFLGLLLLAAAEGITGTALSDFTAAMILLGISGWSGIAVYGADLMQRFFKD